MTDLRPELHFYLIIQDETEHTRALRPLCTGVLLLHLVSGKGAHVLGSWCSD